MSFCNIHISFDDSETSYQVACRAAMALNQGDTLCVRDDVFKVGPKGSVMKSPPIYVLTPQKTQDVVLPPALQAASIEPVVTEPPQTVLVTASEPSRTQGDVFEHPYGEPGMFIVPNLPGFTTADLVTEVPSDTKVIIDNVVVGTVADWQQGEVTPDPIETIPLATTVDLSMPTRLEVTLLPADPVKEAIGLTMDDVQPKTLPIRVGAHTVPLKPGDVIRDRDSRRTKTFKLVEVSDEGVKTDSGRVINRARLNQYLVMPSA